MSTGLDRQAPCPTCGASVTFPFAGARAVVCDYCKSVVARSGGSVQATGRMGELLELPTPFQLHRTGTWQGEAFEVQGRVQMDRADQASAPWQEVLVHFPLRDGHTWVAYAQGRWYATTEVEHPTGSMPRFESLTAGSSVDLGPHGPWVVQEISQRRVVSGEGAMTGVPAPNAITRYADIAAGGDRFGTIDYGDGREPPVLYLGKRFDPAEVRFDDGMPLEAPQARATALECPNCAASLPIQSQATERVICQYCGTASDLRQGALAALGPAPKPPIAPAIAIGRQGEIHGHTFVVTGFVIRSCVVDGVRYDWREYLLFGGESVGYRWLMEEEGSWTYVEPVDAGAVQDGGSTVMFRGQSFSFSQSVQATIDYVIGEFYWKVEIGETVEATEWKGPGGKVSRERTPKEVSYSFVTPISRGELSSFGLAPAPVARSSSGSGWSVPKVLLVGCLALVGVPILLGVLVVGIAVATTSDFEDVLEGEIALDADEKKAMKELIASANLTASSVVVHDDETSSCDWCKGIVIEDGHVTMVRLEQRGITTTEPFSALERLKVLRVPKNQIASLDGIRELESLEVVDVSFNEIDALPDLSGASSLTKLNLTNNQLKDLSGLAGLAKLTELSLAGNPVASVKGLDGLEQLTRLELNNAKLTSFHGLGRLPKLTVLTVKASGLESLAGLDGLNALQELHVPDNALTSLSDLAPLPALHLIDASNNRIASLDGVADLPALKTLNLHENHVASLAGTEGSATLTTLDVSENRIAEVDDVAPTPKLSTLNLNGNQLVHLGGLTALTTLTALHLSNNRLTTLDGVSSLGGLTKLDVSKNQITTLDPLVGMPKLDDVDAQSNKIDTAGAKAFLGKPPKNYILIGNTITSGALRKGRYLSSSSSGSGTRSPSSRYRSGGGPRVGK